MTFSAKTLRVGFFLALVSSVSAQDGPGDRSNKSKNEKGLDEIPEKFVPQHPRTAEERDKIEAARLFATARAFEDRHQLSDALDTLEKARKLSPDSIPILRSIGRISLVLGRSDQAIATAKRLIEIDPGDSPTITLLVSHYLERKQDPAAAEAMLRRIAANPKLEKNSAGYDLVQRFLGDLYADVLNRPKDAAESYARLLVALDAKAATSLSPRDRQRVLDGDEATAYVKFGDVFLRAKNYSLAIQALRRGLGYKPDHPILPRLLAEALAKAGDRVEALAVLEPYLKRQPAGSESYDLLGEILDGMGRGSEVLPRLEAVAKADPKNLRLQFLLAERQRAEGQADKADALLAELLKNQAEPQVYAALAQSYKKEKKADDLVRILGEALEKEGGFQAVRSTIQSVADDPDMAARVLDAGIRMVSAKPPTLTPLARQMLAMVSKSSKQAAKLIALDRAAAAASPSASNQKQLALDLYLEAQDFGGAAEALIDLFKSYPAEKNGQMVTLLARSQFFDGKLEAALESARQAKVIEPGNPDGLSFLAFVLGQLNRDDEAIAVYEDMLKRFAAIEGVVRLARSGLSTCYVNKGDFARGEAELEIIYRSEPDDPLINNDLGYLYADQGKNLEKAESMIRKALEEKPDNGSYLDSLGWCLFKRGKLKDALEPLEKAYKSEQNDLTISDHLGDVYFHLKDFGKAREAWKKAEQFATKTTPPNKKLPDLRKKLAELDKLGPAPKPPGGDGP